MSDNFSLFIFNKRNGFVYKIDKKETFFDPNSSLYGLEFTYALRIGDRKPLKMETTKIQKYYDEMISDEVDELNSFILETKNEQKLPIKYKKGFFELGKETEKWKNQIDDKLLDEFEKILSEKQSQPIRNIKIGTILELKEKDKIDNLILSDMVKKSLKSTILKLKYKDFLQNQWNLKSIDSSNKNVLNFYGKPGTGKTLSAKAIANELGQNILQVDYSQVESKYVGETGKNIALFFQVAKDNNAVILLDEADSLVSKRGTDGMSNNYVNLNRNIFMQELDKFDGTVILTTNLFQNYDEALLRRISAHVEFELPSLDQRVELYKMHIPNEVRKENIDMVTISKESEGFSGGDILNVCINAMVSAVIDSNENVQNACLKEHHLKNEITKIKQSKRQHQGTKIAVGISCD